MIIKGLLGLESESNIKSIKSGIDGIVNYVKSTISAKDILPSISTEKLTEAFDIISTIPVDAKVNWDEWAKSLGYTDEKFVEFLTNTKNSEKTFDNYQKYVQNASKTTTKFAKTFKALATNIGIIIAISAAIKIASYAWDKFNTTVSESQKDLDKTQDTIVSLNGQIEELEKIDANALTQGQKDKLENLKEQLKVQEQLEQIEKRRIAREIVGAGNFADYFDEDSYANASGKIAKNISKYQNSIEDNTLIYNDRKNKVSSIQNMIDIAEQGDFTDDYISKLEEKLIKAQAKQEKSSENIIELQNELISSKADVQNWINVIQGYIDDGSLVGSDLEEAKEDLNYLNSQLKDINGELKTTNTLLYGGDDNWENVLLEKTQYTLSNLKDHGFTDEQLQVLSTLTFDKNASMEELEKLIKMNDFSVLVGIKFDEKSAEKQLKIRLRELEKGGTVNLLNRPEVSTNYLNAKGWDAGEGTATVFTNTFSNEDGTVAINFTPIIADPVTGKYIRTMTPDELQTYAEEVISGVREDDLNLQIGSSFTGEDAIEQAEKVANEIHTIHEKLYSSDTEDMILYAYQQQLEKIQKNSKTDPFTETNNEAIDKYQSKLESLKDTMIKLNQGNLTSSELMDLQQEFPELRVESENLEDAIKDLIYNSLNELLELLGEDVPDNLKTALEELADEASNVAPTIAEALPDIQASYDALEEFKTAMSTGMSQSALSAVGALSDELNTLVAGYYAGAVTQQEIFEALKEHYQIDLENYGNALIAKNMYNEQFYEAVGLADADLVNSFAENYGVDLTNCKNYAEAKLRIEEQTLKAVSTAWSKYYDVQSQTFTEEYMQLGMSLGRLKPGTEAYDTVLAQVKQLEGLAKAGEKYKAAMDALNNIAYEGIQSNFESAQKKLKDSTESATDALEKQKEALEELKAEYDELYDAIQWFYDQQIDKIDKKIEKIEEENEALEKQRETYDDILGAIESYYDARKQEIQDEIDKLKDSNDEQERALELEEAKRKLQEARSRKTKLIYQKGIGFTYQTDETAIKEAEETLENLQEDEIIRRLEEELELLDEELEKWQEIPDAYNKAQQEIAAKKYFGMDLDELFSGNYNVDEIRDKFADVYYNNQAKIDKNEERIQSYEKEKEKIEELKQAWEDAKNEYEYSQYEAKLASFFGSDYEYQLLNNSATWRRKFADEYSNICAQIEALEERIKASNEETASSTEASAEKVAGAANKVKDSTKDIKFEINNEALTIAKEKLEQLDFQIGIGQKGLQGVRDAVSDFITNYEKADGCTTLTKELTDSVEVLKGMYEGTGSSMEGAMSKVASDIETFKVQSKTMSENLSDVDEKMKSITESESQVEESVNTKLTDTEKTISDLLLKLDELKTRLGEIKLSTDEIENAVDEELIDTSTVVDGIHTKVGEIQSAIELLQQAISPLEGSLDTLLQKLSEVDKVTLSGIIGVFGGASGGEGEGSKESGGKSSSEGEGSGSGGSGLLGAVKAVDEAIGSVENPESLLGKLQALDDKTLENIISQFGLSDESEDSEGGNLLSAVNAVSRAILGGKDNKDSLISNIEKLGSDPTIEHVINVSSSFQTLQDTISECIKKVEELSEAILSIPSSTASVNVADLGGSGTAHFGSGTAHINKTGDAYFNGTGNIALSRNHPNSLVGELGTELKVSKDGTYELITSPTMMDLEKGDMIFNHEQTEEILKHGNRSNVEKLNSKAKSVYSKLTGNAFAEGTMKKNVFNALINGLQTQVSPIMVTPNYKHALQHMANYNGDQSVSINIGDIHVHGVENVNGLSQEIINRLPNTLLQKLSKR